jgi:hypothetical protein
MARGLETELGRKVTLNFRWAPGEADPTVAHLAASLGGAPVVTDDSDGLVDLGFALEVARIALNKGVVIFGALRGLLR